MLSNRTIVVGVTGGIAIYKTLDLISRLKKENANVEVIMTNNAKKFINPITFQTMSKNVVHHEMFSELDSYDVEHISLAKRADLIVIAPASANTIGKLANGIADNLLTTVVMASKSKKLIAPAMNTQMYLNSFVQENMMRLERDGYNFISPNSGLLACGDVGLGKMSEPKEILKEIIAILTKKDLKDFNILVTAGPTQEELDPVRYITNKSSGKMGYSLAEVAYNRGANVKLISGPSCLEASNGVELSKVISTEDMMAEIGKSFKKSDVLIMSAAPSDFKPKTKVAQKIKKDPKLDSINLELIKNPDILSYYSKEKTDQIIVGFAAETENLESNALKKLKQKDMDFIVANNVGQEGAGFDVDTNIITIIDNQGNIDRHPIMSKMDVANIILDKIRNIKAKS